MKTWFLVKYPSGRKEWMEQHMADYAWQTGQIPGAKAVAIMKSETKPDVVSDET